MTLGAILMLGGVSVAGAEDVSSLWSGAFVSGFDGVLPTMPQNWSQLPFTLSLQQAVNYNTNVFNVPVNNPASILKPEGSFVDQTNLRFSTLFYAGQQQFFADGNYGVYRYVNHGIANTSNNSGDLGVRWVLTSRCNGTLVFRASSNPSSPGEQLGVNTINTVTSESFNETGSCTISGNWTGVFNAGVSRSTNSAAADAVNDFRNQFVAAGVRYTVSETNSLQLLATLSQYNFSGRGAALAALLGSPALATATNSASNSIQKQVNLSYTKNFGPNFSVIASVGVVDVGGGGGTALRSQLSGAGVNGGLEPQLTLSATWQPTPKLSFNGSIARVVTPPTQVAGNVQTTESLNAGLNYAVTPKLSFNAGARISKYTSGLGTTSNLALQTAFPNLNAGRYYSLTSGLNYAIDPFLNANLSYQYVTRTQTNVGAVNLTTPTSIIMLALSFAPH